MFNLFSPQASAGMSINCEPSYKLRLVCCSLIWCTVQADCNGVNSSHWSAARYVRFIIVPALLKGATSRTVVWANTSVLVAFRAKFGLLVTSMMLLGRPLFQAQEEEQA